MLVLKLNAVRVGIVRYHWRMMISSSICKIFIVLIKLRWRHVYTTESRRHYDLFVFPITFSAIILIKEIFPFSSVKLTQSNEKPMFSAKWQNGTQQWYQVWQLDWQFPHKAKLGIQQQSTPMHISNLLTSLLLFWWMPEKWNIFIDAFKCYRIKVIHKV